MTTYKPNLQKLRKRLKLTQEEVAKELDVSIGTYRNWEQGREGIEALARYAKLCEVLQCNPSELLEEVQEI